MRERNTLEADQTYADFLFLRLLPSLIARALSQMPNRMLSLGAEPGRDRVFSISEALFADALMAAHRRSSMKPSGVVHFRDAIAALSSWRSHGTYVHIHSLIPHRAYQVAGRCEMMLDDLARPGEPAQTRAHLEQTLCALRLVGELIAALKAAGRWSDTVFVVHADHGHFRFPGDVPGELAERRPDPLPQVDAVGFGPHVIDAASAFMALKVPGREGGDIVDGATTATDVTRTLAQAAGLDFAPEGALDLTHPIPADREVSFFYRGQHQTFTLRRGPGGWHLTETSPR